MPAYNVRSAAPGQYGTETISQLWPDIPPGAPTELRTDNSQLSDFLNRAFLRCQASKGFYGARSFTPKEAAKCEWFAFAKGLHAGLAEFATQAAREKRTCAPPVALFGDDLNRRLRRSAAEGNVVEAPVIVVDLDAAPENGLAALRAVLGEPTMVVASGGSWTAPDGRQQDKLHVYWRLVTPARSDAEKRDLKAARCIAAAIAGGDPSAQSLCHPMRLPGSWHTKGEPRLCRIIDGDANRELVLSEALASLEAERDRLGLSVKLPRAERPNGTEFGTPHPLDEADLKALADIIPNAGLDWEDWNNFGLRFFDASHGSPDGAEAFHRFSERSAKYDADETDNRWSHYESYPPTRVHGGKTLLWRACQAVPGFALPSKTTFRDEVDPAAHFDPIDDSADEVEPATEAKPNPFLAKMLTLKEAAARWREAAKPLVKNWLFQGALSVMYGDSNIGKTFVAIDIGASIATGRPWGDNRVSQGSVVYIAAEGGPAINQRAAAALAKYGASADDVPFTLFPTSVDLIRPDADEGVKVLIEAVREITSRTGCPVSFIVVDTLSRALAGGDENKSTDMGHFVKNADMLRQATGAHVMVVHHTGKDASRGARGWSGIRAAIDTEIELTPGTIAATKQRDCENGRMLHFRLEPRKLGLDDNGDMVTSCSVQILTKAEASTAEPVKPSAAEAKVLRIAMAFDGDSFSTTDIAPGVEGATIGAVKQSLQRLFMKGHIERVDRGRWRIKARENGLSLSDPERLLRNMDETAEDKTGQN